MMEYLENGVADMFGVRRWRNSNGGMHREGGPSLLFDDGSFTWYLHGKPHRIGGPAQVNRTYEHWYEHGATHRIGGPAVTDIGREEWWENGLLLHRVGAPARIYDNPTWRIKEAWSMRGLLHRTDGPAVILVNGTKEYHLHGVELAFDEWLRSDELTISKAECVLLKMEHK